MKTITKEQILFDLQLGGIKKGDVVLMQSALSSIGYVEGGADAVIGDPHRILELTEDL